jgi:AraC family transcriptional regulator, ethanolamine operon transcriptional activator
MISMSSLSRRAFTDWRGPLLLGGAGLGDCIEKPLEFYEYARTLGRAGEDALLISASRGSWHVSRHLFGRIVLQSGATGGGMIFAGTPQAGSFTFCLQDPDCDVALSLNGQAVAADDLVVLPPGRQFALVCAEARKWVSLSVPLAALEAAGVAGPRLRRLGEGAALIHLRDATSQLSAAVMDAQDNWDFQCADGIERSLLRELAAAITAGDIPSGAARYASSRSLERINRDALGFIRRQDGLNSHVEDLCRAIEVAERSLLRAFHRFFGMGPTQYMKLRRLNRVHCELQAPDCKETTVTGIMTKCGVTELGRFAGEYRALFGESPSETLKRKLSRS